MGKIAHLKPGESIHTNVTEIHYEKNVKLKRAFNAVGALVTFVVFIMLLSTKFLEGAWVVALFIPFLVYTFYSIRNHYKQVANALSIQNFTIDDLPAVADLVIVPVGDVHKGSLMALRYGLRISDNVSAVTIITGNEGLERLLKRWNRFPEITKKVELVCLDYDYRDILTPIIDYIVDVKEGEFPHQLLTVLIPEFIPKTIAEKTLHNQTANLLRARLRAYEDIVLIDVPYHL
jgi:Ca2+/Na+ antiporter